MPAGEWVEWYDGDGVLIAGQRYSDGYGVGVSLRIAAVETVLSGRLFGSALEGLVRMALSALEDDAMADGLDRSVERRTRLRAAQEILRPLLDPEPAGEPF